MANFGKTLWHVEGREGVVYTWCQCHPANILTICGKQIGKAGGKSYPAELFINMQRISILF